MFRLKHFKADKINFFWTPYQSALELGLKKVRDIVNRAPLVLQDVETDLAVVVDIWVEHLGEKPHPRRLRWELFRKIYLNQPYRRSRMAASGVPHLISVLIFSELSQTVRVRIRHDFQLKRILCLESVRPDWNWMPFFQLHISHDALNYTNTQFALCVKKLCCYPFLFKNCIRWSIMKNHRKYGFVIHEQTCHVKL